MEDTERRSPPNQPSDQRSADFIIPDEISYDLKKPFQRVAGGGETISRLTFRPPTVGEMKKVSRRIDKDGQAEGAIMMMAILNNDKLTEPDIERINYIDFQICTERLEPFLELLARSRTKS